MLMIQSKMELFQCYLCDNCSETTGWIPAERQSDPGGGKSSWITVIPKGWLSLDNVTHHCPECATVVKEALAARKEATK